jgi:hypothetical protein
MKQVRQIKLKDNRKANVVTDKDGMLLRIYHWEQDAGHQLQVLNNCGVGTDQIVEKIGRFVTIIDPRTQATTFHVEAVSVNDCGSGQLYIIEVHDVTEEQRRRIDSAEHALNTAAPWYLAQEDIGQMLNNASEHESVEARA